MIQRHTRKLIPGGCLLLLAAAFFLSGCNSAAQTVAPTPTTASAAQAQNTTPAASAKPEWFGIEMTDVRTGKPFTINDFAGKVVLIETMAEWCPNCRQQEDQVKELHARLGNPPDLISLSLDVDLNEDAQSLQKYAQAFGYDWHFAIAPLEVQRALGNLYSAEYLNPPLAPMLLIDRKGRVYGLPFGIKSAQALKATIEPHLTQ